jgi:adenosylmethionine-8-amino-7-oxononanoate aminotransferase
VGALSVGDCERYTRPYRPLLFPVATITGLPRRHGPEDPAWDDAAMEWPAIAAQLDRHAATLAAIVYEPVLQAAGGMRFYSPDLLRRLRSWADAHGVYLVADEIAAGCGRLGPMLASHLAVPGDPAAALPDLACLAKGLSGGVLPLGAVLATDAIYGLCAGLGTAGEETTFLHSTTWCGNALAVAVADAVLDVLVDEGISEAVVRQGRLLRAGFADLARGHLPLTRIRGCGMVAAADLVGPDGGAPDPAARTGLRVCREAIRRGLLLRPLGDTLYLLPPLTSTPAGIDRMLGILGDALRVIAQGG